MNLNKTILNLKKSHKGFFNLKKGDEVWFEILKDKIYVYKKYDNFTEFLYNRNYHKKIRECGGHFEYYSKYYDEKYYDEKFSVRKNTFANLSYNIFLNE